MSFFGDLRHTPAATKPPGTAAPPGSADPSVPLRNLSAVQTRMDNLQKFLSDSITSNSLLGQCHMDMVSSEITSAIHQIIVSGGALLTCTPSVCSLYGARNKEENEKVLKTPDPNPNPKVEIQIDDDSDDYEIIEMDAVELLAEHVHFCEICGKGFKRDANLRMHMRAHGNQFKTLEALVKPEKGGELIGQRRMRFSCPYVGCNRNKLHRKFKPLKSAICVKNHFKRSHCPKMYSCNRCNKKSFSVVSDLKSHLKHCGESKWKCSCGTSFSRKDKLFGHMALFEGHMPAVMDEGEEETGRSAVAVPVVVVEDDDEEIGIVNDVRMDGGLGSNDVFLDGVLDEFGSIEDYSFEDMLNSTNSVDNLGCGMEGFFNFDA